MIIFVTGIGTEVGKTICSAILVEALKADYWKPVQAGELDNTDSKKVGDLITNNSSKIHPETYRLNTPASPHYAAEVDGLKIELSDFVLPSTQNHLLIEGAGGLMVPLSQNHLVVDLIKQLGCGVIVVSKHYLGSINHTLLSIEALKSWGIPILGLLFNGEQNNATESIIEKMSGVRALGRVNWTDTPDKTFVKQEAENLITVLRSQLKL